MMDKRDDILALTQTALLNAVILSFLSTQFVFPFAFILLLWIIPAIFAFQIYYVPPKLCFLSGLTIIVLSFFLFGIDVGFWLVTYLVAGTVLGVCRRLKCHWSVRILLLNLTYIIILSAISLLFAWIAQISWQEILKSFENYMPLPLPFVPFIAVGIIGWALLLSIVNNWLFGRILYQLYVKSESKSAISD